ncbi:Liprin-alpha-2 [Bulinus truncatus]|nr:Liprin-alpha-2 [Bulinus truncatus]
MMCDVMPTISEDGSTDRESQGFGGDYEQLMVNMLDERDKLMDSLREKQEALDLAEAKLIEANKDREIMQKQLQQTTPQCLLGAKSGLKSAMTSLCLIYRVEPLTTSFPCMEYGWCIVYVHFCDLVAT